LLKGKMLKFYERLCGILGQCHWLFDSAISNHKTTKVF